ncbi:putative ribonuclease H protein [Senna tora]|uniref:Putative ribonuclease H protein n=1 Tax=Senna tora TaxID=362788 RepID=A0A834WSF9_9FABA|nr:putative ribonuclease H protein [Senna tora]
MVASDRCPLFLNIVGVRPYVRRPFRFHNMWLSFGECMRVVSQSWSSTVNGSPAFILSSKLQIVGRNLKQWNRDEVGSIQNRIRTINEQLLTLQQTQDNNNMNSQWAAQQESLRQQMEFFLDYKESIWAQKARMSWKEEEAKLWKGLKISRRAAPITHMMYADDTILFFEATDYGCQAVQRTLSRYAALSGQRMNLQKSFLVFSPNTSHSMKKTISSDLGLKFSSCLGKYLGTWIDGKCSKKKAVEEVVAKVRGKLQSWKSRCLSQAARLTLINSVINSYLVYPISTIYFAKNDCRIIESIMARFFWGDQEGKRKVHLLSWKNLCRPRYDGGLGCRDVSSLNIALLAKHLWRMVADKPSYASSILSLKYADASTPDALTISVISVSATNQKDRLIWKHAPDGEAEFVMYEDVKDWFFNCIRNNTLENQDNILFVCVLLHTIWRCRNQKTMEGYQSCPQQALAAIYSQFSLYKMAFELNVNHPSQFNPVLHAKKFREVHIRDYISADGVSIFCNSKKGRRRNGVTVSRCFFLLIRLNGVPIVEASYCLTSSQSLHQAFLIVLRRGIQLSQASATTSTCNFFMPNQRWTALLSSTQEGLRRYREVGLRLLIQSKEGGKEVCFWGGKGTEEGCNAISDWMHTLLPVAMERGTCIITNVGAMDPLGAQAKVLEIASGLGLNVSVAVAH